MNFSLSAIVAIVALLLNIAVGVNAQPVPVTCFATNNCGGSSVVTTMDDCCSHRVDPVGLSYSLSGSCRACPVVLGFYQTSFVGSEREEDYSVEFGFLSGSSSSLISVFFQLNLGTASAGDISLTTTQLTFPPNSIGPLPLLFTLRVDRIAQESEETFTVSTGLDSDAMLIGTILDSDVISISLSEDDYRAFEGPDVVMPVLVTRNQDFLLANPISVRISPLTVGVAQDRGLIDEFIVDEQFSPNRANDKDFDGTTFIVTFPADETGGVPMINLPTPVPIVDDELDEASQQFFIVFLEVIDAVNTELLNVERIISTCIIVDNDAIRIGFALPVYEFVEPNFLTLIDTVTLIKEEGRISEQTFFVDITTSEPTGNNRAATLESEDPNASYDFSLSIPGINFIRLFFPPDTQSLTFTFLINSDDLTEGVESFVATATSSNINNFPIFLSPITETAFQTTEIRILDAGSTIITVGFEERQYTVNENDGSQEVCVVILSPIEELVFDIVLFYVTSTDTADESDFTESEGVIIFSDALRRKCFDISITDDTINEDAESFTIRLSLVEQNSIRILPDVTRITIFDNDDSPVTTLPPPQCPTCPPTPQPPTCSDCPVVTCPTLPPLECPTMTCPTMELPTCPDVTCPTLSCPVCPTTGTFTTIPTTTTPTPSAPTIWFELRGVMYLNNTVAVLDEIGEGEDALHCLTNNENCCRATRRGEFYYPGGPVVPISSRRQNFYRNRGVQFIRLNRRNDATSPSGKYRCEIPDASGVTQNIFITLLFTP